jgi:hypothetical protein
MTRAIRSDPVRFGVQEAQVKLFERMLGSLEGQLFDGMIFLVCPLLSLTRDMTGI